MKIKRYLAFLFLLFITFSYFSPLMQVNAAELNQNVSYKSWTQGSENDSIYGTSNEVEEFDDEGKTNWVEDIFIGMIKGVGTGLNNIFKKFGLSIDSVIFGRVNSNGTNGVAMYTFELKPNNPYGLVASMIYSSLRTFCYIAIVVTVFAKLALGMYSTQTAQARAKFKSTCGYFVLTFLLLTLMPYIVDLVLYIRDIFLYSVAKIPASNTSLFDPTATGNLIGLFKENANTSVINSFVYVAAVAFALYLGFQYIGYAMSFLVCFISFPLVAFAANTKKELLSNWVGQVAYFIAIPIMDATLLLVPACISRLGSNYGFLTLMCCTMIVPSRNVLSRLLGLNSGGTDLLGLAAMMGTARIAGSAIKTVKGAASGALGKIRASHEDRNLANYEQTMADMESGKQSSGTKPITDSQPTGTMSSSNPITDTSGNTTNSENTTKTTNTSQKGSTDFATNVADQFATLKNFDDAGMVNNLSHAKKAEMYRKRARRNAFGAVGHAVGGVGGAFAGGALLGSAGLMMGVPASTTFASLGMEAGYDLGSVVGDQMMGELSFNQKGQSQATNTPTATPVSNPSTSLTTSDVEHVSGTVLSNNLPTAQSTNRSVPNNYTFSQEASQYAQANKYASVDAARTVTSQYYDHPEEKLKPIYDDLSSKYPSPDNSDESTRNAFRTEFRSKVAEQYKNDFASAYYRHPQQNASANPAVENAYIRKCNESFDNSILNKDTKNSFLSDSSLDSADWFNF